MNSKLSIFVSLLIGIGAGLLVLFLVFHKPGETTKIVEMPKIDETTTVPAVVMTMPDQPADVSWTSPDGKKNLIMKTVNNPENTKTYSFSVSDTATESGQLLFSKTVNADTTMSIPFNTWSPGNQYVFIQEHSTGQTMSYVFKSSGQLFSDGQPYLDVNAVFASKKLTMTLRETTGWAAPTLLIINTDDADLKPGPSYWLDISSKSVTKLSSQFP